MLKTDGEFIYSVSGTVLSIIKAYPYRQAGFRSTIKFENVPSSLFIDGDYLAVFGTGYEKTDYFYGGDTTSRRGYFFFKPPFTWVHVYKICDKSRPKLIKNYTIEGYYFNGRKT